MRKLILTAAVLALAGPAFAADLPKPAYKAAPAPVVNPLQFYVGVVGMGAVTHDHVDWISLPGNAIGSGSINPAGVAPGLVIGVKNNFANGGFLALEADGFYLIGARGGVTCVDPFDNITQCTTKNTWAGSMMVKVGAPMAVITGALPAMPAMPLTIPTTPIASAIAPYVTGGATWRNVTGCIETQGCSSTLIWGWAAGAGLQIPVAAIAANAPYPNAWLDLSVVYTRYDHAFIPGNPDFSLLPGAWKQYDGAQVKLGFVAAF